jgi:hypothetical protein
MSTVKSKKLQVGTDASASNNFTIYQPSTPDGTLRIGVGNADSPTEVAQFTSAGIVSGVSKLDTATGSAPSYSARAWVNFNGTGTVAIRASGNVSSITDNGTGTYTVNFSTAMSDGNYAIGGLANHNTTATNSRGFIAAWSTQMLTTSCRIRALGDGGSLIDFEQMNLIVLR